MKSPSFNYIRYWNRNFDTCQVSFGAGTKKIKRDKKERRKAESESVVCHAAIEAL